MFFSVQYNLSRRKWSETYVDVEIIKNVIQTVVIQIKNYFFRFSVNGFHWNIVCTFLFLIYLPGARAYFLNPDNQMKRNKT